MKVLCDHSVAERYVATLRRTDRMTVATVRNELSPDATDEAISEYAERHGWVVFTEDDDFRKYDHDRGLVLYTHLARPSPADVVDALRAIADAYPDHTMIDENVPDGWV